MGDFRGPLQRAIIFPPDIGLPDSGGSPFSEDLQSLRYTRGEGDGVSREIGEGCRVAAVHEATGHRG